MYFKLVRRATDAALALSNDTEKVVRLALMQINLMKTK